MSADSTLRLWDLTKGRPAFCSTLPSPAISVRWSDDGSLYALLFSSSVRLHDGATGAQIAELRAPAGVRLLDMALYSVGSATLIAAGCEGGDLRVWHAGGAWCTVTPTGAAHRVRCVAYCDAVEPNSGGEAAGSGPKHDVHPLSKLATLSALPVVLPCDGPFLATVDSACVVSLWPVSALMPPAAALEGAAKGAKKVAAASACLEIALHGVVPAATLVAGSGARATALVATRLHARESSQMTGHALAPPSGTASAAAAAQPGAGPGVKRARTEVPGRQGGEGKRGGAAPPRPAAPGGEGSSKETVPPAERGLTGAAAAGASAAAALEEDNTQQIVRTASAAASALSRGSFKVITKAKHAQVLRPPPPPAALPRASEEETGEEEVGLGEARPAGGGGSLPEAEAGSPRKKGVRFADAKGN